MGIGYSRRMTEGVHSSREQAVERIKVLLDDLLDANEELQTARTEEEMFASQGGPPPVPRGMEFHAIEQLVIHNELRTNYENGLQERQSRRAEAESRYHSLASKVAEVIPEGAVVVHEYRGIKPQLRGRHRVTYDGNDVQIVTARY
jgi:hypothetical protein